MGRKFYIIASLGIIILVLVGAFVYFQPLRTPEPETFKAFFPKEERKSPPTVQKNKEKIPGPRVTFAGEKIIMDIEDGRVTVTGHYYFRRNDPEKVSIPLIYPFPVNGNMSFPDTVEVFQGDRLSPVEYRENIQSGAIYFKVNVEMESEFTVRYSQELHAPEAVYILETTKAWGRPLLWAEFVFSLPAHLRMTECSYTPDSSTSEDNRTVYRITRKNFMPDRNLTVRWTERK